MIDEVKITYDRQNGVLVSLGSSASAEVTILVLELAKRKLALSIKPREEPAAAPVAPGSEMLPSFTPPIPRADQPKDPGDKR